MPPRPSRPPEAQSSPSTDSNKSGRRKLQIVVGSRTAAVHACEPPRDRRLIPGTPDTKARRRTRRQQEKLRRLEETRQSREHLGDPTPLSETSQGLFHFDQLDQIDQLTEARLADPERAFMMRLLAVCTLPRTDPGDQRDYRRDNGPYRLYMTAGAEGKLPFGNIPRLALAWICTEVTRTKSRTLRLGRSLSRFMDKLGIENNSGGPRGDRTRVREQITRLFEAEIQVYEGPPEARQSLRAPLTDMVRLWWDPKQPGQDALWETEITIGERFFNEILAAPMPLDMNVLRAMKRSTLGIDIYMWSTAKTFRMKTPFRITWGRLYDQFGSRPGARDNTTINAFRKKTLRELKKLKTAWPELDYRTPRGALELRPCRPLIAPADQKSTDRV